MQKNNGSTLDLNDFIYDSSKVRRYRAICNGCQKDRGYVRKTTQHKMCMSCGQKGKISGRKGQKISDSTRAKLIAEQSRRLALKGRIKRNLTEKKIIHNIRSRLWQALKGINKSVCSMDLIGCSSVELKNHLESKFQSGMTWDNYGKSGWHIDHIRPLSSFDFKDPKQLGEACHYTNLQPLWAKDNIAKGDKYEE